MSHDRSLPADLTIYAVGEWHGRCLDWLVQAQGPGSELALDASAVAEIDGAGLQLLVSLAQTLQRRGQRLRLEQPGAALQRLCTLIGAGFLLGDAAAAGAGA